MRLSARASAGAIEHRNLESDTGDPMEPVPTDMPDDVLIVEDDPIIALDFEDTILGFGVKTVRPRQAWRKRST